MRSIKLVANIAHGHDVFRCACVFLDFVTQMADMHVDDSGIAKEMIIPYPVQQLLAAEHFPFVTAEEQ